MVFDQDRKRFELLAPRLSMVADQYGFYLGYHDDLETPVFIDGSGNYSVIARDEINELWDTDNYSKFNDYILEQLFKLDTEKPWHQTF